MDELKTGHGIHNDIENAVGNEVVDLSKKKWCSVDWLKGKIDAKISKMFSPLEQAGELTGLNWVKSVITDICLDCKHDLGEHCEEADDSDIVKGNDEDGTVQNCKKFKPK